MIALALVAAMAVSALAGCKKAEEKEESQEQTVVTEEVSEAPADTAEAEEETAGVVFPLEEPLEFTMFNVLNGGEYKLADIPMWNAECEEANISFEHTEFISTEAEEKANLLISGGDYPDVFCKMPLDYHALGSEGIVIPLEDLIREYAPNLSAILDERDAWSAITSSDGHIYALPCANVPGSIFGGWQAWYNQEWAKRLGYEDPTSLDELYAMLKAFADEDANGNGDPGDEIPFTFSSDGPSYNCILMYFSDAIHYKTSLTDYKNQYQCVMDGEMKYYPLTEEFKDNYLGLLVDMYNDGILDPNGFTQTYTQVQAIGKAGDVYGMFFNQIPGAQLEATANNYHTVTPFNTSFPMDKGLVEGALAISDKCENPEVVIAWIDRFYSEEGGRLAMMGIEGVDYSINEDGTAHKLHDTTWYSYGMWGTCPCPALRAELYDNYEVSDPAAAHITYEKVRKPLEYGVYMPTITFTEDEDEQLSDLQSNLGPYIANYIAEVVVGQKTVDDTWEAFQSTLKEMGAEEVENIYKTAYARAIAE